LLADCADPLGVVDKTRKNGRLRCYGQVVVERNGNRHRFGSHGRDFVERIAEMRVALQVTVVFKDVDGGPNSLNISVPDSL
jgi:hypothetical protein